MKEAQDEEESKADQKKPDEADEEDEEDEEEAKPDELAEEVCGIFLLLLLTWLLLMFCKFFRLVMNCKQYK